MLHYPPKLCSTDRTAGDLEHHWKCKQTNTRHQWQHYCHTRWSHLYTLFTNNKIIHSWNTMHSSDHLANIQRSMQLSRCYITHFLWNTTYNIINIGSRVGYDERLNILLRRVLSYIVPSFASLWTISRFPPLKKAHDRANTVTCFLT